MHYVRSILFDAAVVILTLVVVDEGALLWLFNASSATVRAVSQVWANGIVFLMKYVVGLDYRESGRENVPDGPCIIACNHQSLWETAALCVIFPDASIVAKKELRKLPFVGWFLQRYPMILVDRSAGRQALRQMVDEARRAVGEGRKVLIFPQGTRQAIDQPMTFQPAGIAALYTNLTVPVVPAAHNSGLFWGKKTLMIHSGTITLSFLPPIAPGLDRKEFQEKMERMISEEAGRLLKVKRGRRVFAEGTKSAKTTPCTVENWASHHLKTRDLVGRNEGVSSSNLASSRDVRRASPQRREKRKAPDELRDLRCDKATAVASTNTKTGNSAVASNVDHGGRAARESTTARSG